MNMANLLHTDTTGQKVTHTSVLALHDLGVMIKLWGSAKDVYSSHVEKRHIETQKRKGRNQVYFLALNRLKLFL